MKAFIYTLVQVRYELPEDEKSVMDKVERVEACLVDYVTHQDGRKRDQHAVSFIKRGKM